MKSFKEYLKESTDLKKYSFKIKIAGDLPEHAEDVLESAMQQYQVSRFTKGKSTPIQASLFDFPTLKNCSMTVFEVDLDYPTTSTMLAELISNSTGIPRDNVRVKTPAEEAAMEAEFNEQDKDSKPLLTQNYEKSSHQDLVGEKRISNFLKELSKAEKTGRTEQYKGANDQILAKSAPKAKKEEMAKPGPAKSLFSSKGQ